MESTNNEITLKQAETWAKDHEGEIQTPDGRIADLGAAQIMADAENRIRRTGSSEGKLSEEIEELKRKEGARLVAEIAEAYPEAGKIIDIDDRSVFVLNGNTNEKAFVFSDVGLLEINPINGSEQNNVTFREKLPGIIGFALDEGRGKVLKPFDGVPYKDMGLEGKAFRIRMFDLQTAEGRNGFRYLGIPEILRQQQENGEAARKLREERERIIPAEDLFDKLGLKKNIPPKE